MNYVWKNVRIGGGGFVPGIEFHPAEPGLRYCRTDMGGAYRWDEPKKEWTPLLDWLPLADVNLMGVESIGLDPSDPDKLYLACGTYTLPWVPDGAILISNDRGTSFKRIDVPFKMGGNENGRGNGERLAIDPNNGRIIYMGTRNNGLWSSSNAGMSWQQVQSFPDVSEVPPDSLNDENEINRWRWSEKGSGVFSVVFDPKSGNKEEGSLILYVAVSLAGRDNLYQSKDAGKSWEAVPGHPKKWKPTDLTISPDGSLYLTYGNNPGPGRMTDGSVWTYDPVTTVWRDITPVKPEPEKNKGFGYAAVAVDPQNPDVLLVSSYHRYEIDDGEQIFRSTNGGESWKAIFNEKTVYEYSAAPYIKQTGIHWMFDIEIDPFNSDHALFTTGYGGHETHNLSAIDSDNPITWQVMNAGIEETVALELLSPPEGAHLITAIGDYGGFVHWDLDQPVPEGNFNNPHFGNTDGVACAWLNPELIVRVGVHSSHKTGAPNIGFTTDGGKSWQAPKSMPSKESKHGHIAVSTNGEAWVWTPQKSVPYYTPDQGKNWKACAGVPANIRIVADKADPKLFYGLDLFNGKFYLSHDGGSSFTESALDTAVHIPESRDNRGDNRGGQDRIYTTPGVSGDIWLAAFDGLYHSTDSGKTFKAYSDITEMHGFGFGKAAPKSDYPCLYMIGVVSDQWGIFQSTNQGESWVRINDDQHQWALLFHITGDPKKYGRVYVGTHGRGTLYGDMQE